MVNVLRYVVYAIAVVSGVEACKRTCDIASDKNGYCYYKCTDVCDNVPASQARSKFLADLRSDGYSCSGEGRTVVKCKKTGHFGDCNDHHWSCGRGC